MPYDCIPSNCMRNDFSLKHHNALLGVVINEHNYVVVG